MLPSFLQFMLSLKSCELSGPELGLGHDCRGGGVAVCGHVSVPGIELSMVGEEVVIFDSLVTHLARPAGVVVVGDPIDSTSGLRGAERLARNCSLSEFLTLMNIDLHDFKLFRGVLPGDRSCIFKIGESYFSTGSTIGNIGNFSCKYASFMYGQGDLLSFYTAYSDEICHFRFLNGGINRHQNVLNFKNVCNYKMSEMS